MSGIKGNWRGRVTWNIPATPSPPPVEQELFPGRAAGLQRMVFAGRLPVSCAKHRRPLY